MKSALLIESGGGFVECGSFIATDGDVMLLIIDNLHEYLAWCINVSSYKSFD